MNYRLLITAFSTLALCLTSLSHATDISRAEALRATSAAVRPAMEKNGIPGLAVGLVLQDRTYVFNFGMASVEGRRPVTDDTIFEIGSISKTFTATLASYAQSTGKLQLTDPVSDHLPELANTDFGRLPLYHLATHTTGGLPLQIPDEVRSEDQLLNYFRSWHPPYKIGTVRTYANPGIGALGVIAAKSLHQDFGAALNDRIFRPLGLESTWLDVPVERLSSYAFGYTRDKVPVRVNPGLLANEAYGVKTTAHDLVRFLRANMGMLQVDGTLQAALHNTRRGYFRVGEMTQDLIWEEYPLPVELQVLQNGNSGAVIYKPVKVEAHVPPTAPRSDVWVNKTGSTNGFGAYLAFVPARRFGIVVLANKSYPNEDRVEIAHRIFEALSREGK